MEADMIQRSKIITDTDRMVNEFYDMCDDSRLSDCIKLCSRECARTFPLTKESFADVCVLSVIGCCVLCRLKDINHPAIQHLIKTIQDLLLTKLPVSHYNKNDNNTLIVMHSQQYMPFIHTFMRIKNGFELSDDYLLALIADVTCRVDRVKAKYGHILTDDIFYSIDCGYKGYLKANM
jgi:hypothetical protein